MWAAQAVALKRPEAIRYRAWKRSRLRACGASTEARRKSSGVWPHLAQSTRTITPLLVRATPRTTVGVMEQLGNSWSQANLGLAFRRDGNVLFSWGFDGAVRRWDVAAGKE